MGAAVSATAFKTLADKVCEHDQWIDGNGQPGAKTRLALLEQQFEAIEKKLDKLTNAMWTLALSIGGGVAVWFFTKVLPAIAPK